MAVGTELKFASLDELNLDPMNPRLGRNNTRPDLPQSDILELMKDWTLDELAVSFLESGGFWTHEAVLVTKERLYEEYQLVVIEGNRRLAALMLLREALEGRPTSKKWADIATDAKPLKNLFTRITYIEIDSREDIESFLGFRHVTGIKEWRPAEKAEYIAKLIDERGMDYEEVMKKIGSKTQTVRQNYISYRLLLEIEETVDVPGENLEDRFSVMYLSLRTKGVQKYLHIDIQADPKKAKRPVPRQHLEALAKFAIWLFGDEDREPLFTDSRKVDDFGRILESRKAVEYLERSDEPSFDIAYRLAGGDEPEIIRLIENAADNVELALTRAHLYADSKELRAAIERLGKDSDQLMKILPFPPKTNKK
jgi:hypothetical protein